MLWCDVLLSVLLCCVILCSCVFICVTLYCFISFFNVLCIFMLLCVVLIIVFYVMVWYLVLFCVVFLLISVKNHSYNITLTPSNTETKDKTIVIKALKQASKLLKVIKTDAEKIRRGHLNYLVEETDLAENNKLGNYIRILIVIEQKFAMHKRIKFFHFISRA